MAIGGDGRIHWPDAAARARRNFRLQLSGMARAPSIRRSSAPTKMLAYYAERFRRSKSTTPSIGCRPRSCSRGWAAGTPEAFTFTLKAPRRITHDAKLQRCEDLLQSFCRTARTLGPKLGALLFQLPPTFKKDAAVLRAFLGAPARRHAGRVRVPPPVVARCRGLRMRCAQRNLALCIADSEKMSTPVEITADYAVLPAARRGLSGAGHRALGRRRSRGLRASATFRLFQARRAGKGPEFAQQLIDKLQA